MWLLSVHTVFWDLGDFRLNLCFVLHFVLLLFCVDCCVTLGSAAALVYDISVVCTMKKI
jgi:hypothetical protein